ncbi:hypothetical protein H5410_022016, partial [Solanum commersonii]
MASTSPKVPVCLALKEKINSAMKRTSRTRRCSGQKLKDDEADQRANHQVHRRSRLTAPSDPSRDTLFLAFEDFKSSNSKKLELQIRFHLSVFGLFERVPVVIGSSWVQLKRVNPRPFPIHSVERVNGLRRRLCLKQQL